jgi:hypothetical protein
VVIEGHCDERGSVGTTWRSASAARGREGFPGELRRSCHPAHDDLVRQGAPFRFRA